MENMELENFWNGKRVLITGATGLVGSHITKELLERNATTVLFIQDLNPQSELLRSKTIEMAYVVQGRLEEFSTIERAINEYEIDSIFHLGAQTIVETANRSPLHTFESNIRGTYNLLEACRLHKGMVKRILVASSDKAYGTSSILPYIETMALRARHPYDVSKACADLLATAYAESYNLPIVISRCGNIFGGGDLNWNRLIPGTIRAFLEGQKPIIRSNGLFTRDYIYVKDVVRAFLLLLEKSTLFGEAYNFGPNKPYSVLEVVTLIQKLMNKTELNPIILNRAFGEIQNQYLSSKKIYEKIGWTPKYSFEEGLSETIAWYENYFAKKNSVMTL